MSWLKLSLLVAVCAVVVPGAQADLGAAVRRSAAKTSAPTFPLPIAPVSSIAVPLRRVVAKPVGQGAHEGMAFYVGKVFVGQPAQELQVLFDTSSGFVILPHRACTSKACVEHRRYSPWQSSTAMDVNMQDAPAQEGNRFAIGNITMDTRDGAKVSLSQSDFGDGDATGVWVRDHVCLSSSGVQSCTDMTVLAAIKLDDMPFRAMPNDGIIGLGLTALSSGRTMRNFFARMASSSNDMLPQFGISLGAESGEILFGGHDRAHIVAPIQWFPVAHPEQGYWQVTLQSVRAGNVVVDACQGGCRVVIDSGSSRVGVIAKALPNLRAALRAFPMPGGACDGPTLVFDLGGMSLELPAKAYAGADCEPQLGQLNIDQPEFDGTYTLGESFLRRYYAAFDWEAKRLGFAPTGEGLALDAAADTIFM